MRDHIREKLQPERTTRADQIEQLAEMIAEHWQMGDQMYVRRRDSDFGDLLDALVELHPKQDIDDANVRDMRRNYK